MLKKAKRSVPFSAEYDFRGELATYHRTKDGTSKFVWARRLSGYRRTGKGFTLVFKKENSLFPSQIVLHDPSEEFESFLDEMGIRTLTYRPAM